MDQCIYPFRIRIVKNIELNTQDNQIETVKLKDINNKLVAYLEIKESLQIEFRGIALSEIKNTSIKVPKEYDVVFYNFFGQRHDQIGYRFIRSAIFRIKTTESKKELKYIQPIKTKFFYNHMKNESELFNNIENDVF